MKKLSTLLIVFALFLTNALGQDQKEITDPDEQIIVKKEYDENGNLIAYDSTYIHQWSSDTSFNFSFDDKLIFDDNFPELNDFFEDFINDSTNHNFGFPYNFKMSPFHDEDFIKHFMFPFSDSTFIKDFNLPVDSLHNFNGESLFPDLKQIQKQLQEQFKNFNFPNQPTQKERNEEQLKELEKLRKKHQKEIQELHEKWKKQ